MRNTEIVGAFLNRRPAGITALETDGGELRSYGVVIAKWKGTRLEMPNAGTYHSRTTSRHRNMVRDMASQRGVPVVLPVNKGRR